MTSLSSLMGILWVIFWIYWLVSATNSKRSIRSNEWMRLAGIRIVMFILIVWLIAGTGAASFLSLPVSYYGHAIALDIIGFIFFFLGTGLAIWARVYLGRNWGMPMSLKEDRELVTGGPYHYARHPIYGGIILAMFGSVLVADFFWIIILLFLGIYFIYSATKEEQILAREFPDQYPAYKKRTKMLIPFVF